MRFARTLIFDKDGTIINFYRSWIPWMNDNIKRLNLKSDEEILKIYSCLGYDPKTEKLSDKSLLAHSSLSNIRSEIEKIVGTDKMTNWVDCNLVTYDTCVPITGNIEYIFRKLRRNDNIRIVLSTNDIEYNAVNSLRLLNIIQYFNLIVGSDSQGYRQKPNSDNLFEICHRLGTDPRYALIISDTTSDMKMAKYANSIGVGVLSGIGGYEDLRRAGADYIINDISELII